VEVDAVTAVNGYNPSGTRRGVSVGDGKVYTLAGGNRVVALNKDTGAVVWAVQPTGPGGAPLGNIAKVGTVYWDNMVYVGTNDGNRGAGFAVRSSDGGIVWSFYGAAAPGNTRRRHVGTACERSKLRLDRRRDTLDPPFSRSRTEAWSTGRSATCAAAARRRTASSVRATTCSATRSSR
jgi:hypothetical protein